MKLYIILCEVLSILHTFFYSKLLGLEIGQNSIIFFKTIITSSPKMITIGKNCLIGRTSFRYHAGMPFHTRILNDGDKSFIHIGDNCRINGAYIHAKDYVIIGSNCVIASGVSIIDSNGHVVRSLDRTQNHDKAKGITIGNNVWIGMNACILKGTHIGNNCVIGAGSIISGNVPENSIVKPANNVTYNLNI